MALFIKTMRKHIFLHPRDKKRQQMAVKSALLQDKQKYSYKLEGALLDVNNIKVIGDRYLIVDGYLSMEVIADFHVFSPHPGQTLEGVINKRSKSHLGCLVLETFNAALTIPPSSELDPQVEDGCTFVVEEVVIDGEIVFLRGMLLSVTPKEDVLQLDTAMDDTNKYSVDYDNTSQEEFLNAECSKKHNKSKEELLDAETSHNEHSKKLKKKQSKKQPK